MGSAAVDQVTDARRGVQEALGQEGAEVRAAAGRVREEQHAGVSVQQQRGVGAAGEGGVDGRQGEDRLVEQTPGRVRQSGGLLPPRTAGVVQRFEEERGERIEVHLEWRRKGHEVMGELEDVIEEVIRTAIFNNQTRKRARVELKALRRLRECEEHEEMRERAHREEGTKRVRKAAHSAGEAEEEWASALQGQTDTTQVDGCLPRRVQMHQRMQQTGRHKRLQDAHHGSQWRRGSRTRWIWVSFWRRTGLTSSCSSQCWGMIRRSQRIWWAQSADCVTGAKGLWWVTAEQDTVSAAASRAEVQGYGSAVTVALGQVVMSQ